MEGLTLAQGVALVRELGFPIVVAGYVLFVVNRSLKELTVAITELRLCLVKRERP